MKAVIQGLLRRAGLELRRLPAESRPDLEPYRSLHGEDAVAARRFYNVGAGSFSHPAWTNVGKVSEHYEKHVGERVSIEWDLLDEVPLDVAAGSAEIVYTSHTVEHVPDSAARNFFRESHRVLRPGGTLRVTCPDVDRAWQALQDQDRRYFYWASNYTEPEAMERAKLASPMDTASLEQLFLFLIASTASTLHADGAEERIDDAEFSRLAASLSYEELLNRCTRRCPLDLQRRYPQHHCNWWNRDKLLAFLREAGFEEIYVSAYGQSRAPVLRDTTYFDNTHPKISLYVEARR